MGCAQSSPVDDHKEKINAAPTKPPQQQQQPQPQPAAVVVAAPKQDARCVLDPVQLGGFVTWPVNGPGCRGRRRVSPRPRPTCRERRRHRRPGSTGDGARVSNEWVGRGWAVGGAATASQPNLWDWEGECGDGPPRPCPAAIMGDGRERYRCSACCCGCPKQARGRRAPCRRRQWRGQAAELGGGACGGAPGTPRRAHGRETKGVRRWSHLVRDQGGHGPRPCTRHARDMLRTCRPDGAVRSAQRDACPALTLPGRI